MILTWLYTRALHVSAATTAALAKKLNLPSEVLQKIEDAGTAILVNSLAKTAGDKLP